MGRCARCERDTGERAIDYDVHVVVTAQAPPLELDEADLAGDPAGELSRLGRELDGLDAEEAQDGVHRELHLVLCRACQREWIRDPLGRERVLPGRA